MAENVIGVITSVEDDKDYNGKDYKKVKLGTGQVLNVKQGREGVLKAKWGLLQEGVAIKFIMQDYTKPDGVKIPFVSDMETVQDALPPPNTEQELTPKHQEIIDDARREVKAPQELGMWWKEAGELLRLPKEQALEMVTSDLLKAVRTAYYSQMFSVLGIKVEDKKGD